MTSTEKITAAAKTAGLTVNKLSAFSFELTTAAGTPVGSFMVTAKGELWGAFLRDPRGFTVEYLNVPSLVAALTPDTAGVRS